MCSVLNPSTGGHSKMSRPQHSWVRSRETPFGAGRACHSKMSRPQHSWVRSRETPLIWQRRHVCRSRNYRSKKSRSGNATRGEANVEPSIAEQRLVLHRSVTPTGVAKYHSSEAGDRSARAPIVLGHVLAEHIVGVEEVVRVSGRRSSGSFGSDRTAGYARIRLD